MPASVVSGDYVYVELSLGNGGGTFGTPIDWTKAWESGPRAGFYILATDTSLSGATVAFSWGGGVRSVALAVAVSGAGAAPVFGTAVAASSTNNPNPPEVTLSGTVDALILATAGQYKAFTYTFPTGYDDTTAQIASGVDLNLLGHCSLGWAFEAKTGISSDVPGAFTFGNTSNNVAQTVGFEAAAGGSGRIMGSIAGAGGLAAPGGIAGNSGGLA
jgi:hypothetical protein